MLFGFQSSTNDIRNINQTVKGLKNKEAPQLLERLVFIVVDSTERMSNQLLEDI
jgi:hypothetical protein